MAVVREHLLRDVAGNVHDGLVYCAALCQFRNQRVPVVVPSASDAGFFTEVRPRGLQGGHWPSGITWAWTAKRKDLPLGTNLSETLSIPNHVLIDAFPKVRVERNCSAFSCIRLAFANG